MTIEIDLFPALRAAVESLNHMIRSYDSLANLTQGVLPQLEEVTSCETIVEQPPSPAEITTATESVTGEEFDDNPVETISKCKQMLCAAFADKQADALPLSALTRWAGRAITSRRQTCEVVAKYGWRKDIALHYFVQQYIEGLRKAFVDREREIALQLKAIKDLAEGQVGVGAYSSYQKEYSDAYAAVEKLLGHER